MQQLNQTSINRWQSDDTAIAIIEQGPWSRFLDSPTHLTAKDVDRTRKALRAMAVPAGASR